MSNVVVVDDAVSDPLVQYVTSHPELHIEVKRLSGFLSEHGIEFRDGLAHFAKQQPRFRGEASRALRGRLLNRVVTVSPTTIAALDSDKGVLLPGLVSNAYEFLLSEYQVNLAAHRCYSTVGRQLDLPSQWKTLTRALPGLVTPKYRHAFATEAISIAGFERPIFKSPFDLYNWKPNTPVSENESMDAFVVDRPQGCPVLTYCLGSRISIHSLETENVSLSSHCTQRLLRLAAQVISNFDTDIGEMLWFITEEACVFAAFSHRLFAASRMSTFSANTNEYLAEHFGLNEA